MTTFYESINLKNLPIIKGDFLPETGARRKVQLSGTLSASREPPRIGIDGLVLGTASLKISL